MAFEFIAGEELCQSGEKSCCLERGSSLKSPSPKVFQIWKRSFKSKSEVRGNMNTQRQVYSWSQDDKDYDWNVDEGDEGRRGSRRTESEALDKLNE